VVLSSAIVDVVADIMVDDYRYSVHWWLRGSPALPPKEKKKK
jgi:hypothetical protein